MSAIWFIAFAETLWNPPSMIERFARVLEPALDANGVAYTRVVTWIWLGYFTLNAGIALWTAMAGSPAQWAIYNGAICYVLAGLLFAGEWLVRQRVRSSKVFP
jgi:uncharacterized membrane protein